MICKKCGKEILEEVTFCPYCGEKVEQEENVEVVNQEEEKKPAKCWSVFAKVGKICGIVSIASCLIPFLIGLMAGVPGIVFSILGSRAKDEVSIKNKKTGLTLSIIGTIVSFLTYIILIVVAAFLAAEYGESL